MRLLVLLAFLASGCTSRTAPDPTPAFGAMTGTVTAVDFSPWAYDGDGVITVDTVSGESVRIVIPARTNLCEATLTGVGELRAGERVEVVGDRDPDGSVRPCLSPEHRVTRVGS